MTSIVPHSRPNVGEEEAIAAQCVIASGRLAQGEEVAAFEADVAQYFGRKFGVAVSSGTAALHLALLSLETPANGLVAMPSYVCTALLHAVRAAGLSPLVADIEVQSRNLDVADLGQRVGGDFGALILPHMFGQSADVEAAAALGRPVIEDCALSIGATRDGYKVGASGELAACSFYATKMMTSGGEGGMLLMDEPELADRARQLREYDGLAADRLRFNYKMTDVAAAVGRVQLRRLDSFIARRRELAARYDEAFRLLPVTLPMADAGGVYHRYLLRLDQPVADLVDRFDALGVSVRKPVPQPLHRQLNGDTVGCPVTDRACERDLSIPLFPALDEVEVDRVIFAVKKLLDKSG